MGVVMDPRMKFSLLKRCYDELDLFTSEEKIKHLKKKLYDLFEEYRKKIPLTPVMSSSRVDSHVAKRGRGILGVQDDLFDLDDVPDYIEEGKSSLGMYLEDLKLDMKNHPNLNVLHYWKENRNRFGALTYMAMDILSIPITTVASESSFSIGSRVIEKYRSKLLPSNVQALLYDNGEGETVVIRPVPNDVEDMITRRPK
uniref:HAT C-terminal dimerisation domain-containing protein n=2 Tax=Brassica oleracea TaxID=3712 RepID=A0A0D2ZPM9_BRAOL